MRNDSSPIFELSPSWFAYCILRSNRVTRRFSLRLIFSLCSRNLSMSRSIKLIVCFLTIIPLILNFKKNIAVIPGI